MGYREVHRGIKEQLAEAVKYARENIHTPPDHANPNHYADDAVRDLLEEVMHVEPEPPWDRREYLQAKKHIEDRTSKRGYCYGVDDALDGYYMHDPRCKHWPDGAIGGSGCIDA